MTVVVVLLLSHGTALAAPASEVSGLPNGFRIVAGSELVGGTAFPWVIAATPTFKDYRGWEASVGVEADPRVIYDGYVVQARQKGFDLPFSDQACHADSNENVLCGATDPQDGQFTIQVLPCDVCGPYRSLLRITYIQKAGAARRAPLPGDAPTSVDATVPADAQQPTGGESSPIVKPGERLGPRSHFDLASGSTLLVSADQADCDGGGNLAVLRVKGDGQATFRSYAEKLPGISETPVRTASTRIKGRPAEEAAGDWARVRLVDTAGKGAMLYINECFE